MNNKNSIYLWHTEISREASGLFHVHIEFGCNEHLEKDCETFEEAWKLLKKMIKITKEMYEIK